MMLTDANTKRFYEGSCDISDTNIKVTQAEEPNCLVIFRDVNLENLLFPFMKFQKSIEDLISGAPETIIVSSEKNALINDIRGLDDRALEELCKAIIYNAKRSIESEWEKRLDEYINGDPPPPKYDANKDGRNPIEFLEEVWGKYMDHGVLYQDRLSEYDSKLIKAVYGHWGRHGRDADDRLPLPKSARTSAILEHVAQGRYTNEEIIRTVRAMDRRGQRSRDA